MAGIDSNYHINIELNYKSIDDFYAQLNKTLSNIAKKLNSNDFRTALAGYSRQPRKLRDAINKDNGKLTGNIIDRVVDRYLSFDKADGRPVGRSGTLEKALKAYSENFTFTETKNSVTLHIMDKGYLSGQTPSATSSNPYYIYQHQTTQGPRYLRFFITNVTGISEEIHETDQDLIFNSIKNALNRYFSERG